ncbi:hypothetical protein BGZ81_004915 [Podila clonocystis]|nr:hypothetical protein BGZ81_004915 [Podila clonocystis]
MSYQIARYFNIITYTTYLVMDTFMNLSVRQVRNPVAQLFNDCLAILLIIAYARKKLSEDAHWYLSVVTFSSGWIWPIIALQEILTQWWMQTSLGPHTYSFEPESDGSVMVLETVSAHTVWMGRPATTTSKAGIFIIWFWPSLYLFNIVFGLTLVLSRYGRRIK